MGWLYEPKDPDAKRGEVQDLVRWSNPMLHQDWVTYHIKDTGMGAMVWEIKAAPFWMKRGEEVAGPYWLVAARDRLHQETIKYFLSDAAAGVPVEVIVHVGFCRWPVERCLEDEKSELGLGHFEVRQYGAIVRHLRITQVSHLFLARQSQRLAGKKSGGDGLSGPHRRQRPAGRLAARRGKPEAAAGQGRPRDPGHATEERRRANLARQGASSGTASQRHPRREASLLHSHAKRIAL